MSRRFTHGGRLDTRDTDSVRIHIPKPTTRVETKRDAELAKVASERAADWTRIHDALSLAGVPHLASQSHDDARIEVGGTTLYFTGWNAKTPLKFVRSLYFKATY